MYTHKNIVNIYLVHELTASNSDDNDPTAINFLFEAVTSTKNADIDKYQYRVMVLDLIEKKVFHSQGVDLAAM